MPEKHRRGRAARLLAVDVGNSETTVGRFRGAALEGFWRIVTGPRTADELGLPCVDPVRSGVGAIVDHLPA